MVEVRDEMLAIQPRDDGKCGDCVKREAETKDGRFCRQCLRKWVARLNRESKVPSPPSEQLGRPGRDPLVLGGSPDMRAFEQMGDEE